MSTGGAATMEATARVAASRGLVVVLPTEKELFLDIDSDEALATFHAQVDLLQHVFPYVEGWDIAPSQSRRPGHAHITVRLGCTVNQVERLLLQAVLGSDLKRELLGYGRHIRNSEVVTAFFERPEDDALRRLRGAATEAVGRSVLENGDGTPIFPELHR